MFVYSALLPVVVIIVVIITAVVTSIFPFFVVIAVALFPSVSFFVTFRTVFSLRDGRLHVTLHRHTDVHEFLSMKKMSCVVIFAAVKYVSVKWIAEPFTFTARKARDSRRLTSWVQHLCDAGHLF